MFIHNRKHTYRRVLEAEIIEVHGKDYSGEDVLNYLMGDYASDYIPYGDTVPYTYDYDDKTILQRLNLCWVFPLVLVAAPFQWILTGNTGVSSKTRIGAWLLKITGNLKDT